MARRGNNSGGEGRGGLSEPRLEEQAWPSKTQTKVFH